MKTCTKCKIEKPKSEFNKDSKRADGLQYHCKACNAAYRLANKERIRAYLAEYREVNKEAVRAGKAEYRLRNRERINKKSAAYWMANKEKLNEYKAKYTEANREKIRKYRADYYASKKDEFRKNGARHYAENKETYIQYARDRRAIKRNAEGRHTAADITRIFEHQRGLCVNCHTKLFKSGKQKFHVDHIIPLAKGGSNWPSNLQCLCPTCNLSKGAKDPLEWAHQNGRLF